MIDQKSKPPYFARKPYRTLTGLFGLLLMAIGMFAIFVGGDQILLRVAVGVCILALGCNAVVAAWRAKEPWIARIGPLP